MFGDSGYPIEDAVAEVHLSLLEKFGDAAGCAANNEGLLKTAARQMLTDQFRKAFGRESMPPWVKALGKWAEKVWRLYCKRRSSVEAICLKHSGVREDQEVQALIEAIEADDGCAKEKKKKNYHSPGEREQSVTVFDEDGGALQSDIEDASAIDGKRALTELEYLQLVRAITGWPARSEAEKWVTTSLAGLGAEVSDAIGLSDDERILLRLRFHEGMTIAAIARELGKPRQQVDRPLQRVCARIHDCLVSRGIELSDLIGD